MVMSASRHLFVRPVLSMPLVAWIEAHVAALGFFGGAPRRLVTDNLKASLISPDLYDPKLNRTYAELASHYDVLIDPARARKPKDKPRVERPIPYVRDSFFARRDFASLAAMQDAAARWSAQVAGRRACLPLGGAQPVSVFEASERHALLPLPAEPYELATWSTPKVAADLHIAVDGALYSVPWRYVGRTVDARATARLVEVFVDGEQVKTHTAPARAASAPTGATTRPRRSPSWSAPQPGAEPAPPRPANTLAGWSASCWRAPPSALHHLRAAQGVLRLGERYGPGRLAAACRQALTVGDPSYRTVKAILATMADQVPLPLSSSTPRRTRSRRCCTARPRWLVTCQPRRLRLATASTIPTTSRARGWPDDPDPPAGGDASQAQALRDARHPGRPPWLRPAPVSSATWSSSRSCARTRSTAARPRHSGSGSAAPASRSPPPWRTSTSPSTPSCRSPPSATWPPAGSSRPASR